MCANEIKKKNDVNVVLARFQLLNVFHTEHDHISHVLYKAVEQDVKGTAAMDNCPVLSAAQHRSTVWYHICISLCCTILSYKKKKKDFPLFR